MKNVLQVHFVL